MQWKVGDCTYYQTTHLQVLNDYFILLGIKKIAELPVGLGRSPSNDPQTYIGGLGVLGECQYKQ